MTLQKRIFSQLSKGVKKISKHKLNTANDLAVISSNVEVWKKNIDIDIDEYERLQRELDEVKISLEVDIEDLQGDTEQLEITLKTAEEMADNLGVDASAISNYDNAKETYDSALIQIEKGKNYLNS